MAQEKLSGTLELEKLFVCAGGVTCGQSAGALDTVNSIVGNGAFI